LNCTTGSQFSQIWEGWSTIASPCFWNGLFCFIHLIFLTIILAHSLLKIIREKSERSKTLEFGNSNGDTKFSETSSGLAYQATRACCLIVLASHILKFTFFVLQFYQTDCWNQFSITSEALQSISWVLLSVVTFKFQHLKCTQIPPIIRAWWICTFLQAIIFLSFDIHLILLKKFSIGAQECVNIGMELSSTYLFATSIKGKTGITMVQNDMVEPLLPSLVEEKRENKKVSFYGNASLIQLVTFSWMNPLFAKGYKKPLERDDVPELYEKDASEFVSSSFGEILNNVKERQGLSTKAVYKAIFLFVRKKLMINACFAVASASASYVGPSLINQLVSFLGGERENGLTRGYILAIAFLSAKILETIFQRQWIFGARQLGIRVKGALISHIYQKGLRLSIRSKQIHTSGEIINYMSVDIQRITDVVWYANIVWMLPVQVSLAIFILHQNLGKGAFAGLAATFGVMALNIPVTCILKRMQMKIMASKDARMKATSEVLKSIRILKLQAWDTRYLKKIEELREVEYGRLWMLIRVGTFTSYIFWGSPAFISAITFGTCILLGIPLTAGSVLSALATFQMLQEPILNLPDLLSVLAQGKVSGDRIASYLHEEEIDLKGIEIMTQDESEYEIEIKDGAFNWEIESKIPTLVEIQLKVCKGMKVAICGAVGSGKSSLLSSIFGEIPKLTGVVRVRGTKAYVPQTPWILSGNVRENILFGKPYEKEKYERTIEACALRKDLELFANGDLTEIGERGINMSGGQKQRIQIARAVYQDADIYILDDPFSSVDAHTGSELFKVHIPSNLSIMFWIYKTFFL
jgi:ABC-type multidrug transport system fused ATPase/permease subunit